MKRIDINACFGHWPYWDLHHKSVDDLVASMDRCGIDQAAVMSLRGLFLGWRAGNDETLIAAGRHPDRLVPMATISPFAGGDAAEVKRLTGVGMRGVRLYPTFHSYSLESPFADEICDAAADCSIPVMIPTRPMMNWRFAALPIDAVGDVAERHRATTFILSGPNYLVEYQAAVRLMAGYPNIVLDTTCLQGFNSVKKLVGEVGADRVLFGTGAVLNYPACNVAKLDHASLSDTERRAIASENARRLFGLSPTGG